MRRVATFAASTAKMQTRTFRPHGRNRSMLATFFPLTTLRGPLGNILSLPLPALGAVPTTSTPVVPDVSHFFTTNDVLSPYVWVFYTAFIISFFMTPVMQAVAMYYGIIDQPDKLRKIHSRPVAYLGGVSVFLGW